jgi:hypothetical protein
MIKDTHNDAEMREKLLCLVQWMQAKLTLAKKMAISMFRDCFTKSS